MMNDAHTYRPSQRLVALMYGLVCHLSFAAAVASMALALFFGMRIGRGPFHGWAALPANVLLIASFPFAHTWLLSPKGRRFMSRLVPLGIGPKLSWTVFATISSFQLLCVFWLWSPSGVVWWETSDAWKISIGTAAAAAWLLLGKSMWDAQLGVQTGYVGWSSVFLNRKATYKPFATQGLYRYVRQPIYISFALLLWLAAVWTPDQLVLAVTWTGYCVVGAVIKEKRFLRYFGEAFRNYQHEVPFWFPKLGKNSPDAKDTRPNDFDAVIIGAGPVGLLLANLLGQQGLNVLVAERRVKPPVGSMAIGITPPSLNILSALQLDTLFEQNGIPITKARVFEHGDFLGAVDFSGIAADHRYILSLPQCETIALLKQNLTHYPSVHLQDGMELAAFSETGGGIRVRLKDVETSSTSEITASYLAGCDGHRSQVRRLAGIGFPGRAYRSSFFMADFDDQTSLGREAHLYFGPGGSVESFPLSGSRRRWIVQTPGQLRPEQDAIGPAVSRLVHERAGFDLRTADLRFESAFQPQRRLARTYTRGRVLLCGDAAHVMSPIGGQGMNTGFADADYLAEALTEALRSPDKAHKLFAAYNRVRRHAFRCAAGRAARGMWMGTRTGSLYSGLRKWMARRILFHPAVRTRLAPHFAMLTLPGNPQSKGAAS
ncbi:FAD-dependent monooxygenase [Pontiella agarivorans]|uniref:FAD-dependent monooxygenase n=1 Tax=Pontiella agarivorans TaxID=3038953 RepID=A0ABU5N032_9BACT|nr:FAD-dependent monooxygenase [Pontiella agarivorans]MDZ8119716.1 FAD-dependent monooxygenase [Pontiella agarivorans]